MSRKAITSSLTQLASLFQVHCSSSSPNLATTFRLIQGPSESIGIEWSHPGHKSISWPLHCPGFRRYQMFLLFLFLRRLPLSHLLTHPLVRLNFNFLLLLPEACHKLRSRRFHPLQLLLRRAPRILTFSERALLRSSSEPLLRIKLSLCQLRESHLLALHCPIRYREGAVLSVTFF